MKKGLSLIIVIGLIIFSAANAFALITVPLKCSNALPDGNDYATVKIELQPGSCSGYDGVKITVDANQSILSPNSNFGIQKFGFNYTGDPNSLQVTVCKDDGITPDTHWSVTYGDNISEFGIFMDAVRGTGSTRHDPLIVKICKAGTNLTEADFNVENSLGNNFVAHIASFTYDGTQYGESAFFADCATLITLSSFSAKASNGRVKLEWVTESEIDNAGFNIWRSETEVGGYAQINDALIPAKGSATDGAKYVFTDNIAKNRKAYFYMLEDVDLAGMSTLHGPVSATPRFIFGMMTK